MANKLNVLIISKDKEFYNGDVDTIVVRTNSGDMGIKYMHQSMVSPIGIGPVKLYNDGEMKIGALAGGFLKVDDDGLVLITDSAEWEDEIDIKRAEEAAKRAEERLKEKNSQLDYKRAKYSLMRAVNRINIVKK